MSCFGKKKHRKADDDQSKYRTPKAKNSVVYKLIQVTIKPASCKPPRTFFSQWHCLESLTLE
jgi:hypothetical protein